MFRGVEKGINDGNGQAGRGGGEAGSDDRQPDTHSLIQQGHILRQTSACSTTNYQNAWTQTKSRKEE